MTDDRTTLDPDPSWKRRAGALAAGTAAGLAALLGLATLGGGSPAPVAATLAGTSEDVSGPCDEAEHAADPECSATTGAGGSTPVDDTTDDSADDSSTTVPTTTPTTGSDPGAGPTGEIRTVDAAGAGTVVVAVDATGLRIVSATPTAGWSVEIEVAAGREVEVDFRSGTRRVQVDVELEDGAVRERVRFRDDATDTDIRTEDGVVDDDSSGSSGHGGDDHEEDSSGHGGSGRDHPEDD